MEVNETMILEILGWIVIVAVFYAVYFILYIWWIKSPIDDYLGFGQESFDEYMKRVKGISSLSERLYLKYWDQLPYLVNYVLIVLNLAYVAMMIVLSIVYFTHWNLNPYLFGTLGLQVACKVYIDFATVRLDEDQK